MLAINRTVMCNKLVEYPSDVGAKPALARFFGHCRPKNVAKLLAASTQDDPAHGLRAA